MNPVHPADPHVLPSLRGAAPAALAAAVPRHRLVAGRVQVVIADMDDWAAWEGDALTLLDGHERMRVARQRLARERSVRTLAYAMHRLVLAGALDCSPEDVPLYRDAKGCPQLEGGVAWTSLSHAGSLVAFAVGGDGPVGIDIEPVSRARAMEDLSGSVCHPLEANVLASLPARSRATALLELWVCKEAVLKAAGVGLEVPMESFVATDPASVEVPGVPVSWQLTMLDAGADAVAAVAAGAGEKIECITLCPYRVHAPYTPASRRFAFS